MMYGYDMFGGMGWLGMAAMLLIWIAVIALVIWGLSGLFPRSHAATELDALEIVRRRYARGDMSHEEYLQAIETLHAPGSIANPRPMK
jgi:uncharacterized membrane protein